MVHLTYEQKLEVFRMYQHGKRVKDIMAFTGMSYSGVSSFLRRHGVRRRPRGRPRHQPDLFVEGMHRAVEREINSM